MSEIKYLVWIRITGISAVAGFLSSRVRRRKGSATSNQRQIVFGAKDMAKAKRKGPLEVETPGVSGGNKRQKVVLVGKTTVQGRLEEKKGGKTGSVAKEDTSASTSYPEALRIVIGSYEKVLCGIDAKFGDKPNQVWRLLNLTHRARTTSPLIPSTCFQLIPAQSNALQPVTAISYPVALTKL
jgi:hypothetical protein